MSRGPIERRRSLAAYALLAPVVLPLLLFLAWPLARSLALSLDAGGRVGVGNYAFLATDRLMWVAALNTVGYAALILLVEVPAALGLALALSDPRIRGRSVLRFAFLSPFLVGPVFVAILFGLVLSSAGPVNAVARLLGLGGTTVWLADPIWGRVGVVVSATWLGTGFAMMYLIAALQHVDRALYEAAEIDGAGAWRRFVVVTLPGVWPVLSFLVVAGTVAGLQLFELPYLLFNGAGPGAAGLTVVAYLFAWLESGDLPTAAAVGWTLAAASAGVALLQARAMRRGFEEARS